MKVNKQQEKLIGKSLNLKEQAAIRTILRCAVTAMAAAEKIEDKTLQEFVLKLYDRAEVMHRNHAYAGLR